jgi:stage V sporulation protein AD
MQAPKKMGGQTAQITGGVSVLSGASVAGQKENEGLLKNKFDIVMNDNYWEEKTWEKAESKMQKEAVSAALAKAGKRSADLILAGDLINQCTGTSYGLRDSNIPFYGLFGACSTMAQSLSVGAMLIDGGFAETAVCGTSSHFCSAERQFRLPLNYGGQRPPTAQITVTGAAMTVLSNEGGAPYITHVTTGKIVDKGIKDALNMGAAMAPAAADTLLAHFKDTGTDPDAYDLIVTGDLGRLGFEIVCDLTEQSGVRMKNYNDCGLMIYDMETQDPHCGGSGCGCSGLVLCADILPKLRDGTLKKVLFVGTGALMSPVSVQQGESIPAIAHAVVLTATS